MIFRQNFCRFLIYLIFPLIFLFDSCTTTSSFKNDESKSQVLEIEQLVPQEIKWKNLEDGIQITNYSINSLQVSWHCVKIDLDTPGLQIIFEPHKNSLGKSLNVKKVGKKQKALVAINSTPFYMDGKIPLPLGITKFDGKIITNTHRNLSALCFYKNQEQKLRAHIINLQTKENLRPFEHAFGGFYTILQNEQILSFVKKRDSRTAVGISQDGKMLYILVATPKPHAFYKNGLYFEECAQIFKYFGCDSAMQFDGGNSSCLVVKSKVLQKPLFDSKTTSVLGFKICR